MYHPRCAATRGGVSGRHARTAAGPRARRRRRTRFFGLVVVGAPLAGAAGFSASDPAISEIMYPLHPTRAFAEKVPLRRRHR